MKVMIIENKWLTEMIIQMYHLVQKKNYQFYEKKREREKEKDDYKHFKEKITNNFKSSKINLDYFFESKEYKEKKQDFEDDNPGANLVSFIRIFTLFEKNDSFTFSKEYCDYSTVNHYLNEFSNKQAFTSLCRFLFYNIRVEIDNKKYCEWSYPKWYNTDRYNTFYEFIAAMIEMDLSAK